MRLFIAIDLPLEIRQRITEYLAQLVKHVPEAAITKWVRPESLHLTLKFIGESNRMDDIKGALQQVHSPSFEILIGNVGFFTPCKPRIFWAGVYAPPELEQLVAKVDAALAQVGIPQDKEEYHPHITLARTGSGRPAGAKSDRNQPWLLGLKNAIEEKPEFSNPRFGTMMPKEFFLFRSETLPEGARYTKLASFPSR